MFEEQAGDLLSGLNLEGVAHDFWLTRNRHGAGFKDGDYDGMTGEQLAAICRGFKVLRIEAEAGGKLNFI